MQRNNIFVEEEYYHLLGRGNYKQNIFLNNADYVRFLFLILFMQLPKTYSDVDKEVFYFVKNKRFKTKYDDKDLNNRYIHLVNFCLMPNHYHLTVQEKVKGGISKYMQRVLNAFTKYHNIKYEKMGHLFQGPFKAVHIKENKQLLYLSAYIHHNPKEIKKWKGREVEYLWSSYKDYVNHNRWTNLLVPDAILEQFDGGDEYRDFVESSGAKE